MGKIVFLKSLPLSAEFNDLLISQFKKTRKISNKILNHIFNYFMTELRAF